MPTISRKSSLLGLSAIGIAMGLSVAAQASTLVLPVTNLTFNVFTGTFTSPKTLFQTALPTGWSIGNVGSSGELIAVGQQGSEGQAGANNAYAVYTNPGFTNTVPSGYNFYQADGNPQFEAVIQQTVTGLILGNTYTLTFQQAAGQQTGFSGATTEQWKVFLGKGGIGTSCPVSGLCTVTGTANNEEADSPLMTTASQHNTDWNLASLSFTPVLADLTAGLGTVGSPGSAVLSFLAWGDNGSDVNLPPTVFLEGVNTPVPEPAALSLLGVGLLGLGGIALRRRAKHNVAA